MYTVMCIWFASPICFTHVDVKVIQSVSVHHIYIHCDDVICININRSYVFCINCEIIWQNWLHYCDYVFYSMSQFIRFLYVDVSANCTWQCRKLEAHFWLWEKHKFDSDCHLLSCINIWRMDYIDQMTTLCQHYL